jgi:hypothetical protein
VFGSDDADMAEGNVMPAPLVDGVVPPTPIVDADITVPELVVSPDVPSSTIAISIP